MADPHDTDLPAHDHAGRRDRLRARLSEAGVDALYVTGSANVAYLTGFTGSNGQVLVGADPDADLLCTDARYEGRAAVEAPDVPTLVTRSPMQAALDRVDASLGFEADQLTYRQGRRLVDEADERQRTARPCDGLVEDLRLHKEPSELARLRRACAITVAAFTDMLEGLRPGRTERDLAIELERRFVELGADGLAFDPIVGVGPHAAVPHHEPTGRAVAHGELVLFDIGARVDGYHADFTRTVAVGEVPPGWAEIHELVVRAQQAGVDAVRAEATCGTVDEAARSVIDDAGHGDAFVHGLGHGVGLQIHEAPIVTVETAARLGASTVLTVEPGVYLPEAAGRPDGVPPGGVRIEDTVVVTPDGPAEHLTDAPHALVTLPG